MSDSGAFRRPGLRRTSPRLDEIERLEAQLAEQRREWELEQERNRVRSVSSSDPRTEDRSNFHAAFKSAVCAIHERTIDGTYWSHAKIATAIGVSASQFSRWFNHGDKALAQIPGDVAHAIRRALPRCAWDAFIDSISEWESPSSRRIAING